MREGYIQHLFNQYLLSVEQSMHFLSPHQTANIIGLSPWLHFLCTLVIKIHAHCHSGNRIFNSFQSTLHSCFWSFLRINVYFFPWKSSFSSTVMATLGCRVIIFVLFTPNTTWETSLIVHSMSYKRLLDRNSNYDLLFSWSDTQTSITLVWKKSLGSQ